MNTYKIVRMFFDDNRDSEVIDTGLTLTQAQKHCRDPETSSKTCSENPYGDGVKWFDGYSLEC
jgi:hypothetical protein